MPRLQYLQEMEGNTMSGEDNKSDKSTWAIGGGVLLGLGVGFFFLHQSALYFIGSLIAGLGVGLLATAVLSKIK
jgi:F0F1-type ATP synthase assembly protein I